MNNFTSNTLAYYSIFNLFCCFSQPPIGGLVEDKIVHALKEKLLF
ncbi:MAG: hypothetical protein Q7S64_00600 [bacterium]|nr:hypothetical protein [bacterium]